MPRPKPPVYLPELTLTLRSEFSGARGQSLQDDEYAVRLDGRILLFPNDSQTVRGFILDEQGRAEVGRWSAWLFLIELALENGCDLSTLLDCLDADTATCMSVLNDEGTGFADDVMEKYEAFGCNLLLLASRYTHRFAGTAMVCSRQPRSSRYLL